MSKRIITAILALLLVAGVVFAFGGCSPSDKNYPVTVGQTKFSDKPQKVAVLSDNLADIIYYIGYSTQICAISDSCTQEEMTKYIASVGDETKPDVEKIIASGAEYVLTDKALDDSTVTALKDKDIEVVNMYVPSDLEQLATVYRSLGTMLGGLVEGKKAGEDAYNRLVGTLEEAEKEVEGSTIVKLVCYLYLDEAGRLCSFADGTAEGILLNYLCATNVAANFTDSKVDQNILRLSNPEFIFYDDAEVLDYLKANAALKSISALKNGNTYQLPVSSLSRQGGTLISTQNFMLSKMYPENVSQTVEGESLAESYGIKLAKDMSYEVGADNANVKAIQQRLIDLGYLKFDSDDSATTYYGNKTAEAVKAFQTANGLSDTGVADYETLVLLFMSTTLSTDGSTVTPSKVNTTQAATEPAQNNSSGAAANGYNIDLSSSKSYKIGDENEDIKAIQQRLVDLLYLSFDEGDSPTSYYGSGTENAISLFQESNGLSSTGVADYETLKVLFSEAAKQPQ
ncbi:MAG: peptidoglycan-binding protein [Ruminococcus sp.]